MNPLQRTGRGGLPELLAPAGSYEKLVTAVHYGADAVYLGGKQYSLRARTTNFDGDDLPRAVDYAHRHGVKVYATVNIFAHNADLPGLERYLPTLEDAGVDGLIIADPGVLQAARRTVSSLPLHLSTQANVTNAASARFWHEQGVQRLNLARELDADEIRQIRAATNAELEVFVHGALCISYSGRCMLSNYFTGRDANRGDCAHPCRYAYTLMEEKRPGQFFPVEEDDRGTYIFSSRDLCLLSRLPFLVGVGVDAIKIEGRMKSVGYVGSTVRLYRHALDWIREQRAAGHPVEQLVLPDIFRQEAARIGTRGQTENFFSGAPSAGDMLYDTMRLEQHYVPAGIVRDAAPLTIESRHVLACGDTVEYLGRTIEPETVVVVSMRTAEGVPVARVNPGSLVYLQTHPSLSSVEPLSILRKKIEPT